MSATSDSALYRAVAAQVQERPDDVATWARERLGIHLWSKQREIAEAVRNYNHVSVRSCHAAGKTLLASVIGLWFVDTCPPNETVMLVTSAPSYTQVSNVMWEELRRLHVQGGLRGEIQRSDRWISNDGLLVGFGRRPPDYDMTAFQGIHRDRVLVVLDEASGIPASLWDAVETITTGEQDRILAIGNPDDPSSNFADTHERPDSIWKSFKISAFDTPTYTGEDVPKEVRRRLVSSEWVDQRRRQWGEDSPLWTSKILGEFPSMNERAVIQLPWVTAAQARWRDAELPDVGEVLGVDVARFGEDSTALAPRVGNVVRELHYHNLLDTTQVTELVEQRLRRDRRNTSIVDVIGVGAGVVDQLRAKRLNVTAFNAAVSTKYRDISGGLRFTNVRSASWWNAREQLDPVNDPDLALPPDDGLAAELTAPQWRVAAGGKVLVEAKDDVKTRLNRSTDAADAVNMALWYGYARAHAEREGSRRRTRYPDSDTVDQDDRRRHRRNDRRRSSRARYPDY